MRFKQLCLVGLSGLILIGCSTNIRLGQFTVASSNNVRNLNYEVSNKTKARTEGRTCITYLLGFSFGDKDSRLQRAMDNAIQSGQESGVDGDLLANVRIDRKINSYLFYTRDCMIVLGDLVKIQTK